jgi:hypothetical protein
MPSHPETSDLANIASEHSGEYLRLLKSWQRQTGHNWIFAGVESSHTRDELVAHLDAADAAEPATPAAHLHVPKGTNPVALVELVTALDAAVPRAHLLFPYDWSPDADWWQQCNTQRERLANAFPKPLVFWLPDECITLAARNAPDFWNWRGAIVVFKPEIQHKRHQQTVSNNPPVKTEQIDKKRLLDLENYLRQHESDFTNAGSTNAGGFLWLEAAVVNSTSGLSDRFMQQIEQATKNFELSGNFVMSAAAKEKVAESLIAQNKLKLALKSYRMDVLPTLKKTNSINEIKRVQKIIKELREKAYELKNKKRPRRLQRPVAMQPT